MMVGPGGGAVAAKIAALGVRGGGLGSRGGVSVGDRGVGLGLGLCCGCVVDWQGVFAGRTCRSISVASTHYNGSGLGCGCVLDWSGVHGHVHPSQ